MKKRGMIKYGLLAMIAVLFFGQATAQNSKKDIRNLIQNERYEEALKRVNAALQEDPKDEQLDYLKGRALFLMGDLAQARSAFDLGTGHGRNYPMNYIGLGAVAVRNGDFETAKENLEKASTVNKKGDMEPMLGIADAWMEWEGSVAEGNEYYKAAEAKLLTVTSRYPEEPAGYVKLGELYDLKGISELAETYYERAIGYNDSYLNGHFRLGQLKKKQKMYTDAANHFQRALEIDKEYAPTYKELAEMYFLIKDYGKGEEYYNKYLSMMGGDLKAQLRLGIFQYLGEQYEKSVATLRALEGKMEDPLLYRILAYSLVKQETPEPDAAMKAFDKYFELAPEKFIIPLDYENRAVALGQQGNDSLSVLEFEKAYALTEKNGEPNPEIFMGIANMYKEQKAFYDQALYVEKYLAAKGGNYDLRNNFALGRAYYQADSFALADSVFGVMTVQQPTLYLGWQWSARSLAKQDPGSKKGLAKASFEKLMEIIAADEASMTKYKSAYLEGARYLGAYYTLVTKECEQAIPYWEMILADNAEDAGAQQGLDYCKKVVEQQ